MYIPCPEAYVGTICNNGPLGTSISHHYPHSKYNSINTDQTIAVPVELVFILLSQPPIEK